MRHEPSSDDDGMVELELESAEERALGSRVTFDEIDEDAEEPPYTWRVWRQYMRESVEAGFETDRSKRMANAAELVGEIEARIETDRRIREETTMPRKLTEQQTNIYKAIKDQIAGGKLITTGTLGDALGILGTAAWSVVRSLRNRGLVDYDHDFSSLKIKAELPADGSAPTKVPAKRKTNGASPRARAVSADHSDPIGDFDVAELLERKAELLESELRRVKAALHALKAA